MDTSTSTDANLPQSYVQIDTIRTAVASPSRRYYTGLGILVA